MPLEIAIEESRLAEHLALGVLLLEGVRNRGEAVEIRDPLDALNLSELRALFGSEQGRQELLGPARRLYRALGIDPTKHRPSSEALIRRVVAGDFPRVAPLVDAVNLASVVTRLPFGLYDLDCLEPPIVARLGKEGEGYSGIRKAFVNIAGRIALFDRLGAFGNPTSDSDRAKATGSTERALVVIYGPAGMAREAWDGILDLAERTIRARLGCSCSERRLVGGPGGSAGSSFGSRAEEK